MFDSDGNDNLDFGETQKVKLVKMLIGQFKIW